MKATSNKASRAGSKSKVTIAARELEALRAQLNPHFLSNTLHSLMALVRHDPVLAENALERLAALLRHTLMTMKDAEDVELSEELEFVENCLTHVPFGGQYAVFGQVKEPGERPV